MQGLKQLSHLLSPETPGYGGRPGFHLNHASKIQCGDSCNGQKWTLDNHIGTHIDFPRHFDDAGATLCQYDAKDFVFEDVVLITKEYPKEKIIEVEDIPLDKINSMTSLILFKTGFESYRNEELYWNNNPGFSPKVGLFLRENFPNVRAIGFDFISLTSYQNRPLGRVAHNAFLSTEHTGSPIWIIEDMKLSRLNHSPKKVLISPLLVKNADGAPVTVWSWED